MAFLEPLSMLLFILHYKPLYILLPNKVYIIFTFLPCILGLCKLPQHVKVCHLAKLTVNQPSTLQNHPEKGSFFPNVQKAVFDL